MEIFQELVFTAFLGLILSFILAKLVSIAVSNPDHDAILSEEGHLGEGVRVGNTKFSKRVRFVDDVVGRNFGKYEAGNREKVEEEVQLGKGLRVGSAKIQKRVRFVDDVAIKKVVQYEGEKGSENLELLDGGSVEGVSKRVDQFEEEKLTKDSTAKIHMVECFDVSEMPDSDIGDAEPENVGMIVKEKNEDDRIDKGFAEKEYPLMPSGLEGAIVQEKNDKLVLESDEGAHDRNKEIETVDSGDIEGLSRGIVDDGNEDDDWEGIERSELEKVFAEAVNYVEYGRKGKEIGNVGLVELGTDVQMQLYGLHKVALEVPCYEPQPMALKVSARAKWTAWQRLGSMSREAAMELYIKVLSDSIPDWMKDYTAKDDVRVSSAFAALGNSESCLRSFREDERMSEPNVAANVGDSNVSPNSIEKDNAEEDQCAG